MLLSHLGHPLGLKPPPLRPNLPPFVPVKHRRYTRPMTIAAGFLHRGGILLCSDTLIGSEETAYYSSKITLVPFSDGTVGFAFSGPVPFLEATIQACDRVLKAYNGAPRPHATIVDSIRRVWLREYHAHKMKDYPDPRVILAVYSKLDGVGMYYSSATSIAESTRGHVCVGFGEPLASYLVGDYSEWTSEEDATNIAICMLARVKEALPHACGGDSMLLHLSKSGRWRAEGKKRTVAVEKYSKDYEVLARGLLLPLFCSDDDVFAKGKTYFDSQLTSLRGRVKGEKGEAMSSMCALPPRELVRAMTALPRETKRSGRALRRLTKRDPSGQPPSLG